MKLLSNLMKGGQISSRRVPILTFLLAFTITSIIPRSTSQMVERGDPFCPEVLRKIPTVCSRLKCLNNINETDCALDTFYTEGLTMCGCCPGCAKYLGLNEDKKDPKLFTPCTKGGSALGKIWQPSCSGPNCPILLNTCMPGLVCNEASGLCTLPTNTLDPCRDECEYKKSLKKLGLFHWDPDCELDGSYKAKQCKGDHHDGICYCVDPCGKRTFGREWRVSAQNQTCACSKLTNQLRTQGNTATFHCSSDGNFEALQCDTDSGICYCVEEKTGKLLGAVVAQAEWKKLPCFTQNVTNFEKNGRYLRKCESEYAASKSLVDDGKDHGTSVNLRVLNCDYDGSYGPLQVDGTLSQCVYKNGSRIKDFMTNSLKDNSMDCHCARDQFFYQISALPFSFDCEPQKGNYITVYNFGSISSCVDRDGVPYGDLAPSKYTCCLRNECIPQLAVECYDEVKNPRGYRRCCAWPFGGPCSV